MKKADKDIIEENEDKKPTTKKKTAKKTEEVEVVEVKKENKTKKAKKVEAEQLEIEIESLNDPEYLAKYARENYSYSKDGEYIIKLKDTEDKIEKVDDELNKDYIVVGLVIFIIIVFVFIITRSSKKNK